MKPTLWIVAGGLVDVLVPASQWREALIKRHPGRLRHEAVLTAMPCQIDLRP